MSWGKLLPGNRKRVTGGRNLVSVHVFCPPPGGVPSAVKVSIPSRQRGIAQAEKGKYMSEYELAFPEITWDAGYLTRLCFC